MAVLKVDMIIEGDIQSEKRDPKANPMGLPFHGMEDKEKPGGVSTKRSRRMVLSLRFSQLNSLLIIS